MTKEHKQLVLVVVLSITLYAVWPSAKKEGVDTAGNVATAVSASNATVAPNSAVTSTKHSASREYLVSGETHDSRSGIQTDRQRWSIDEILKMGPREDVHPKAVGSVTGGKSATSANNTRSIQAVYFTSSSHTIDASAIVGGKVVKRGQALPGNRMIGEIHPHGIAIESVE